MLKSRIAVAFMTLSGAGVTAAPAAVVGPDAAVCRSGGPAVEVHLVGFKQATGTVKLVLYRSDGWLQKGGKLNKAKLPVQSVAPMDVCLAVPKPGRYAVAVHHDLNDNGERDLNDGGGYSRNPRLSLLNLRPDFGKAAIEVGSSPRMVPIELQYRRGLSVGPVAG